MPPAFGRSRLSVAADPTMRDSCSLKQDLKRRRPSRMRPRYFIWNPSQTVLDGYLKGRNASTAMKHHGPGHDSRDPESEYFYAPDYENCALRAHLYNRGASSRNSRSTGAVLRSTLVDPTHCRAPDQSFLILHVDDLLVTKIVPQQTSQVWMHPEISEHLLYNPICILYNPMRQAVEDVGEVHCPTAPGKTALAGLFQVLMGGDSRTPDP